MNNFHAERLRNVAAVLASERIQGWGNPLVLSLTEAADFLDGRETQEDDGAVVLSNQNGAFEALCKFVPAYEEWMDKHGDNVALSFYRPATFGDLRDAHAAIQTKSPT